GGGQAGNPQIDRGKPRGCRGETSQGLIEPRPGQGCGGEASLVGPENADRTFIYETLMQQNKMPASDAPRVRAAFAQANRDLAKPGEWIQQPDGQWTKKGGNGRSGRCSWMPGTRSSSWTTRSSPSASGPTGTGSRPTRYAGPSSGPGCGWIPTWAATRPRRSTPSGSTSATRWRGSASRGTRR